MADERIEQIKEAVNQLAEAILNIQMRLNNL